MVNSRVSRKDLDSEMTVVRNEFERGENNPRRVLEERVVSTAYLWHSYGRSTIGARSDIEHVPIERLQAFYRNYYQPDNAILIVAGKFDEAKTLAWIKEDFGAIPRPTRTLTPTYTEEPVQDGEREVTLQRVGDNQLLMMAYHVPSGADPDSAAVDVLTSVLDEAPSGRLYKALVESKKAISVHGENNQQHDAGYLLFTAEVRKEGSLDDVRKTMDSVLEGVVKEPPSKDEIERVLTRRKKDFELLFNNSQRVALLLSEWTSMGDWRLMFLDRDRTEKVTPGGRGARREGLPDGVESHRRPVRSNGRGAAARRSASRAGCDGDGQRLHGSRGSGSRRGLRSFAREYRRAHTALYPPERTEGDSPAEENPRRDGDRDARSALRR